MGAAVHARVPVVLSFLSIFSLSLLSLVAAFILSWSGKGDASLYLAVSGFLATVCAVIGTTGKVTLNSLVAIIRSLRGTR